jgi:hypothetical protein
MPASNRALEVPDIIAMAVLSGSNADEAMFRRLLVEPL